MKPTRTRGVVKDLKKPEMNLEESFFQCTSSSSEKMDIPRTAVLKMQGNSVILRDHYGNLWPVEVEINGDRRCFKTGWPRFYQDNSLEQCDILVFYYRGENLYDFTLYGENECEKKGVGALELRAQEEVVKEYTTEEEEDEDDSDDDDYELEEEERVVEEQVGISKKRKSNKKSKSNVAVGTLSKSKRNVSETEGVKARMFGINTMPERRTYQKTDCYGDEIFKAGLATRPNNRPFFVSRQRTSRKNDLLIPKAVIVDYKLEIPEELFLVDEKKRKWKTKIIQWKDGRLWCTGGGWSSLCHVNNIDEEDICICEFVKQGCTDMHILVRVVEGAGGPGQDQNILSTV